METRESCSTIKITDLEINIVVESLLQVTQVINISILKSAYFSHSDKV